MKHNTGRSSIDSPPPSVEFDSRRRFLRATAAPLGAALLSACGGGRLDSQAISFSTGGDTAPPPEPSTASVSQSTVVPTVAPSSTGFKPLPAGPLPAWVSAQPLWTWFEIPGTALSSVDPLIKPPGWTGPRAKIESWCGSGLRRLGSVYLIGAAGGHTDYAGNEVNALALNVETPKWVELRAPSATEAMIEGGQFYMDYRPSAAHTYWSTQFIDSIDRMMVFTCLPTFGLGLPSAPADYRFIGDKGAPRTYSFDFAKGDWDAADYVAPFPGKGDTIAALCVKHPVTSDVYVSRSYGDGLYKWKAATNTWSKVSGLTRSPWYAGAAIDPRRERMLLVGGYQPTAPRTFDLNGFDVTPAFQGLGATALSLSGYPGVVYEEAIDAFVVFYNTDAGVQTLLVGASDWAVAKPPIAGTLPAKRPNGLLNSVQYVPELRGVVLANRHAGNVYFMRTSS